VDEIHAGMLPNRTPNRCVICIKLRAQCSHESIDVRLGHGDYHIHGQCRPRLTTNGAGNRPADKVQESAGLKERPPLEGRPESDRASHVRAENLRRVGIHLANEGRPELEGRESNKAFPL
jgi:hypothetical protein